jgi:hypothetical protein
MRPGARLNLEAARSPTGLHSLFPLCFVVAACNEPSFRRTNHTLLRPIASRGAPPTPRATQQHSEPRRNRPPGHLPCGWPAVCVAHVHPPHADGMALYARPRNHATRAPPPHGPAACHAGICGAASRGGAVRPTCFHSGTTLRVLFRTPRVRPARPRLLAHNSSPRRRRRRALRREMHFACP